MALELKYASDATVLLTDLVDSLGRPSSPAGVVVPVLMPSLPLVDRTKAELARRHGVAMGVEFLLPGSFIERMARLVGLDPVHPSWRPQGLAWRLVPLLASHGRGRPHPAPGVGVHGCPGAAGAGRRGGRPLRPVSVFQTVDDRRVGPRGSLGWLARAGPRGRGLATGAMAALVGESGGPSQSSRPPAGAGRAYPTGRWRAAGPRSKCSPPGPCPPPSCPCYVPWLPEPVSACAPCCHPPNILATCEPDARRCERERKWTPPGKGIPCCRTWESKPSTAFAASKRHSSPKVRSTTSSRCPSAVLD